MSENRAGGTTRNAAGKVEEAAGAFTGDARTEARGRARQVTGQAQNLYGQAVDEVEEFARATLRRSADCGWCGLPARGHFDQGLRGRFTSRHILLRPDPLAQSSNPPRALGAKTRAMQG